MKRICTLLVVLLILSINSFAEQVNQKSDTYFRKNIIGTWKQVLKNEAAKSKGIFVYKKDGSVTLNGIFIFNKQQHIIKVSGTWKIKNGQLITTVHKTNRPKELPIGHICKDKIIEINKNIFKYKTVDGEIGQQNRINKETNKRIDTTGDTHSKKNDRQRIPMQQPKSKTQKQDYIKIYEAGDAIIDAGFIPDKTKIILGQPLFITFSVTTKSDVPYKFFIGGDNRGSVRHNNFRITAIDAYGKPAKDPHSYNHHGGMGNDIVLKHNESYNERLFLGLWCAFDKPGVYTVTCQRTLREYGKKPRQMPVLVKSSFKLTIAPFTKKQMSDVIADFGKKLCDGKAQDLHEASLALSTIADEQVIPYLAFSLTRGSYQNKRPAIQGLSQFSVNAAANALIVALKASDYAVRNAAGDALRNIKKTDYALQLLLPGLKNKSPATRAQTAQSLGILKAKGAYDALLKATHDTEPAVRYAAAIGLGTLGYRDAIKPLKRYIKDKDMGMRIAAVKGLRALGVTLNPQWLIPVIRATSNVNDQNLHEAIRLTRLYGGKEAAPALVSCLNFDDPSPRNSRNMFLLLAIHHSPGGPQYYYKFYSNPNTDGTPKQIENNRKILAALKKWLDDKH